MGFIALNGNRDCRVALARLDAPRNDIVLNALRTTHSALGTSPSALLFRPTPSVLLFLWILDIGLWAALPPFPR